MGIEENKKKKAQLMTSKFSTISENQTISSISKYQRKFRTINQLEAETVLNISMICEIDENNADEALNEHETMSHEEEVENMCSKAKKPRLIDYQREPLQPQNTNASSSNNYSRQPLNLKTLSSFSNFMRCPPTKANKLTKSTLNEIVLQKVCEVLAFKSPRADQFEIEKRNRQKLELLQKRVEELEKRCYDLMRVNKKLMDEVQSQKRNTDIRKPLVPQVNLVGEPDAVQRVLTSSPKVTQINKNNCKQSIKKLYLAKKPAVSDDVILVQKSATKSVQSASKSIASNAVKAGPSSDKSSPNQAPASVINPTAAILVTPVNFQPTLKLTLPKPIVKMTKLDIGVVLQWEMPYQLDLFETIGGYQLWASLETGTNLWKKIADIQALPLPMACNLPKFTNEYKFQFAVCAVDVYQRAGALSDVIETYL